MKKIIVALLVLLPITLFSNDLRFKRYSAEDGLSNENTHDIIQDGEGYIWIATDDGLDRFDGTTFRIYRNDMNDTNSIVGNVVMHLLLDSRDNLWVATNQGLCMYNKYLDRFERSITAAGIDKIYVKYIIQDSKGNYWIASGPQVYQVSPNYELIQTLTKENDKNWIGSAGITSLAEDMKGNIWITTQGNGIFSYNPKSNVKKSYSDVVTTKEFFYACPDSHGDIWFGTHDDPYVFVSNQKKFYNLFSPDCPFNLPRSQIISFTDDKNGYLWLSTRFDGVFRYNIAMNTYTSYSHNENDNSTIGKGVIDYTYFDKEGNLWTIGYHSAINVSYKNNRAFHIIKNTNSSEAGIFYSAATQMKSDKEGNMWLGSDGSGLTFWDRATNTFTSYRYDPDNPRSYGGGSVLTVYIDSKENVWSGGYHSALNLYNKKTNDFTVFREGNQPPYAISGKDIRYITEDNTGKIWVATLGGGINIIDPETDSIELVNVSNSGIVSDACISLMMDDKNRMFIGTYSGFSIYNLADKSVENFTENKGSTDGLPSGWVFCFLQDTKGRYWLGTQNGLSLYNDSSKTFKTFFEEQGLANDAVMSIIEDNNGQLWVSTGKGLSRFSPEDETFQNFTMEDGLPGNEFKMGAGTKTQDDQIFFGTSKGVLFFNPNEITINKTKPILHLTELYINNNLVVPGKSKILQQSIDKTDRVKLNHKENFLRIDFVGLSYFQAGKNTYKYKLEGVDPDWVNCGTTKYASYTNIRHGYYTFKVVAFNNDGVPSEVRSMRIRIKPAWYNTKLFYLFILFSIVYGIYRYIKQREITAKHDKEVLEKKIAEGEKVIKEKIQQVDNQQKELQERDELEKETRFFNEGIAHISNTINKNRDNIKELSTSLISELVKYIGACTGVIYVADDSDPENIVLRLFGSYCYNTENGEEKEFLIGEGYVGTCFKEQRTIEIEDLPTDYIHLTSGLGKIPLSYCILVPVIQGDTCLAVIEIADIQRLPEYKRIFTEKISDSFSSILAISKANANMKVLLESQKIQAEELKAHEEELKQNMEEMGATQEEMNRQIDASNIAKIELAREKRLTDSLLETAREKIYFKDKKGRYIKVSQSMAEMFNVDDAQKLIGKTDFDFFTKEHAQSAFNDEMSIIEKGEPIIDKIEKETHKDGRITYASTTKMPLRDEKGIIIGTCGISKDVTQFISSGQQP